MSFRIILFNRRQAATFIVPFVAVFLLVALTLFLFVALVGCQESKLKGKQTNRGLKIDAEAQSVGEPGKASWPNLFGPNRQSQVSDSRLPKHINSVPKEKWRIEVGTGYSAPVLNNDRLFVSHRRGGKEFIECFSVEDGESIWSHSFPAPYKCQYEYSDGPYSTPVLFDDRIIVVGQAGHTFCLTQEKGKIVWQRDLFKDYGMELGEWPVAAGGIAVGNRFVFNLGAREQNAGVIGLEIETGETAWQCTQQEAGHATPNLMKVGDRTHVIMVTSDGLISIDPEVGQENWTIPFRRKKAETYNAVSPVVFGNKVCMVTGPGPGTMLVEIDENNGHQVLWKNRRILDSQYTNLLCVDGFLFGFTPMKQGGPELRCIDLLQEKLAWKWKARMGRAMVMAINETIIILGEKGNLAGIALSSESPEPLFRTESPLLSPPCYSAPAYYDGRLFLRNEKHLVCLELQRK